MIRLNQITIRAGTFSIPNLSMQIDSGQYAVLMGKTGCGKTTLLESICGLRPISSGSIVIDDTDVTHYLPGDRQIGYVPQDLALFPTLNVQDHLAFALRLRKMPAARIAERIGQLAEVLGITHLLGRRIFGLSGGESQRVALGRALAAEPKILLLDEPLSKLDEETRGEMQSLLQKVKQTTRVTTLHITHNSAEAVALADLHFRLENGRLSRLP
jgi:ABC-type sugar transport system ATPase subunit